MNQKIFLISLGLYFGLTSFLKSADIPVIINLKDGKSLDIAHFGQHKCGTNSYSDEFVLIRGMYMGTLTEIKNYSEIEKIVLVGFKEKPGISVGNEKGTLQIHKRNGQSFTLDNAEITMSCYGVGDLYNTIIVKIYNPITSVPAEQTIETRNIQSIIFK